MTQITKDVSTLNLEPEVSQSQSVIDSGERNTAMETNQQSGVECKEHGTHEPSMQEVMKTLRILSQASRAKRGTSTSNTMFTSPVEATMAVRCDKCHGLVTTGSFMYRKEIFRRLDIMKEKLQEKEMELPPWVVEYRKGNSMQAARLLHFEYTDKCRKRKLEEIVTSTTEEDVNADDEDNNKRKSKD